MSNSLKPRTNQSFSFRTNSNLRFLLLLGLVAILSNCALKPTQVYESTKVQVASENKSNLDQVKVTDDTIIIDARPAFEYSLSRLSGSINLRPEEFNQKEKAFRGVLEKDLFFHARRLARMGISLETPVIVVGRGPRGQGEEGRVAWTLKYLGLKNVQFVAIDYFNLPLVTAESEPRKPQSIWRPVVAEDLLVDRKDFVKQVSQPRLDTVIIDARPVAEYLGKVKKSEISGNIPDIGAINIPWSDFFDQKGLVDFSIRERLISVGIVPEKKIFVISNQGAESAAVTLALRQLGYAKAANYSGGYLELINVR